MSSPRLRGPSERLGTANVSDQISAWSLEAAPTEADIKLLRDLGHLSVLLSSTAYGTLPRNAYNLRATFIDVNDFGIGREDSRHQVRFGQMLLNGRGIHENHDFVAVKPYDNEENLHREWAANAYANAVFDEQRGFMPLAVTRDEDGNPAAITLYEHGVKTFDNVFWADREEHPEALGRDNVINAATTCMYGLGLMHGSRLIHGDPQVKNLGKDNRHVRFIDLEDASLIPEDAIDDPEVIDKILRDVSVFIDSTLRVEENRERISEILHRPKIVSAMLRSYRSGLDKARLAQGDKRVPDYAKIHEEAIRDVIQKNHA